MTSIETRASWLVAFTVLAVMSFAFGAPFIAVVALKQIAGELGSARTVPALAYSLAWFGSAVGGLAMGRIADRVGAKWTVAFGAAMYRHRAGDLHRPQHLAAVARPRAVRRPARHRRHQRACYIYVSRWFDGIAAPRWH